ncbi:hypothetical protein BDV26DRAFT_260722 [Aspergillus bertholletiae]|uniref:CFEM domain-containing protein n=1 Tax=Aspergillus bertholletiae TaxID=1226010 RepID=A0A5N7BAS3_9EURO|nr:hypothetical protein BDV26DRAFT_260722 [Aspergillus bertholletiae]
MKLSLTVSLTAVMAAVTAQHVPQCLADCILAQNICTRLDINCFCQNSDFYKTVKQCIGGDDGNTVGCSEEDQKTVLDLRKSICGLTRVELGKSPSV